MNVLLLLVGIAIVVALVRWTVTSSLEQSGEETIARNKAEWDRVAKEEAAFLESAKLMNATVLSASQSGRVNNRPNIEFRLRVDGPDGPYEVETTATLDPMKLHRFAEGCDVEVFVDPEDPQHVKICRA